MARQWPNGGRWWSVVAGGLILAGLVAQAAPAADPSGADQERLQAQLAAGEFAPALETARQAADPAKRDAWLGQVAVAQAASGILEAAVQSASEIGDDRSRADTLARVKGEPAGAMGGNEADFDSLIDLITSTVKPTSWDTPAARARSPPFQPACGSTRRACSHRAEARRLRPAGGAAGGHCAPGRSGDVRRSSPLRMVSLPRLEKQVQLALAAGRPPTEAMQILAGLQRIQYVLVYPETGDLVLAGPAGDWMADRQERIVSTETGEPVLRLDDLVVVLRHMLSSRGRQVRLHDHAAAGGPGPRAGVPQRVTSSRSSPMIAGLAGAAPRTAGQAGHRGLRIRSANAAARVHGRGRLPHETGGHGAGGGRAGRGELPGHDQGAARAGPAAHGRAALVVHAELRRRAARRKIGWRLPSAARASRCKARTSGSRPRENASTPASPKP